MTAQLAETVTASNDFPALRLQRPVPGASGGEFHPIAVGLAEDYTEVTCAACGPLEHIGSGAGEGHTAHGADHAIATGHTVTERHIRVSVITGYPA